MRRDNRGQSPVRNPRGDVVDQSLTFRRSRTITGSSASSVRAAGEARGQLQSSRLHEHSLRKHRRKLSVYFLVSLVACGTLWYVISSYIGGTVHVGTRYTQALVTPLDTVRYQADVKAYFKDRPLEQFQFSLNETAFNEFMRAKVPEIASATLAKGSGLGDAELALVLREPIVAWTIKNQQYFVDGEGSAFTVNYFAAPSVIVTDKSGVSARAGVVASKKLLRFMGRVITLVNASDIPPIVSVELPANSTREVDFKLKDRGYIIKAHLDRDPAGQAADIINAVRYVEGRALRPEYLDVRISSRVYYRDTQ